jgi:hypothetical protein
MNIYIYIYKIEFVIVHTGLILLVLLCGLIFHLEFLISKSMVGEFYQFQPSFLWLNQTLFYP